MAKKMDKEIEKKNIIIPRKALFGIAPAIAILSIILSKNRPGQALLFLIGIVLGGLIVKEFLQD